MPGLVSDHAMPVCTHSGPENYFPLLLRKIGTKQWIFKFGECMTASGRLHDEVPKIVAVALSVLCLP